MIKNPINEYDLLEYTRCPMRINADVRYLASPLRADAMGVLTKLLVASFNGEKVTLKQVREKLDKINKRRPEKYPELRLVRLSARLHELFSRYRVLQPITPYRLHLDQFAIEGNYAVLQRTNVKNEIAVLRVRGFDADQHADREPPDIVNYIRWAHLVLNEPEYRSHVVLNFHLLNNIHWLDSYNEKTVRKAITAAGRMFSSGAVYPAPGVHCSDCLTNACEVA